MNTSDLITSILEQISIYATQIDELDRFSANYVMTCVAFGGVLLGVLVAFIGLKNRKTKKNEVDYQWRVLSVAIFMIPALTSLCVYDFSLNCRKVAMYRGYISFLENKLNEIAGSDIAFFNSQLIDKYYEGSSFPTNQWGYILVIYFVVLIFIGTMIISLYCNKKDYGEWMHSWIRKKKDNFQKIYIFLFLSFYLVSIPLTAVFMVDLADNSKVIDQVYEYSLNSFNTKNN